MTQGKTPGVYIVEKDAFPTSVVEVATAVPAFLGYTEKAVSGKMSLFKTPTRLSSMTEFETLFGGPPDMHFGKTEEGGGVVAEAETRFLLYYSMRLFFDNGGASCWVTSLGPYRGADAATPKQKTDFLEALDLLAKEPEPTMLVAPDAVLLSEADWTAVSQAMMAQCSKMQDRIAILDVYGGDKSRIVGDPSDPIARFRKSVAVDARSFGVAYYPWLNSSVVCADKIDPRVFTAAFAKTLAGEIEVELELDTRADDEKKELDGYLSTLVDPSALRSGEDEKKIVQAHQALMPLSATYRNTINEVLAAINLLPPAAGMAGVYTRTDANFGVFKAPANTDLTSVLSPCVEIGAGEMDDLDVPLNGLAVNAIRSFEGRGVLVWGARTLDGNSSDWHYVSVRRTLIFLEQSIKMAVESYVFAPNTQSTWITVADSIRYFLNSQWKAGALQGATPEEAYEVSVGLGSIMTASDVLDGYMKVVVKAAVMRPAEFTVLKFQQKMQTS